MRKRSKVDVVLDERLHVFAKAELAQPILKRLHRGLTPLHSSKLARTQAPRHVSNSKIKRVAIAIGPFLNALRSMACDHIAHGPYAIFGQGKRHSETTAAGRNFGRSADQREQSDIALPWTWSKRNSELLG